MMSPLFLFYNNFVTCVDPLVGLSSLPTAVAVSYVLLSFSDVPLVVNLHENLFDFPAKNLSASGCRQCVHKIDAATQLVLVG